MNSIQQLVALLALATCSVAGAAESDDSLSNSDAWGKLSGKVHPHERWAPPPPRAQWQSPYPPSRWYSPPQHHPAEDPYPPSLWYSPPQYHPRSDPYPPSLWYSPQQPHPRENPYPPGRWMPPPPSYQYWNDGYRYRQWDAVTPSELSREK